MLVLVVKVFGNHMEIRYLDLRARVWRLVCEGHGLKVQTLNTKPRVFGVGLGFRIPTICPRTCW